MRALAMRQTSDRRQACAAQITMGAEVSGSLRRTPSRPSAERGGLDGVALRPLVPAASLKFQR